MFEIPEIRHPLVKEVRINDSVLHVITHDLIILHSEKEFNASSNQEKEYNLGSFDIVVPSYRLSDCRVYRNEGTLQYKNLSFHMQHPHVYHYTDIPWHSEPGIPCWGNITPSLESALSLNNIPMFINLVITFLKNTVWDWGHSDLDATFGKKNG